jgi:hypothetical protein
LLPTLLAQPSGAKVGGQTATSISILVTGERQNVTPDINLDMVLYIVFMAHFESYVTWLVEEAS